MMMILVNVGNSTRQTYRTFDNAPGAGGGLPSASPRNSVREVERGPAETQAGTRVPGRRRDAPNIVLSFTYTVPTYAAAQFASV